MKEIKFRAWDGQMVTHDVFISQNGECHVLLFGGHIAPAEGFTIMQYTGFKDVDGVEIYEGDVTLELSTQRQHIVRWSLNGWPDRCVGLGPHGGKLPIKVIGNIYENPELCQE